MENMEVEILSGLNHIKNINKKRFTSVRIYSITKKTRKNST